MYAIGIYFTCAGPIAAMISDTIPMQKQGPLLLYWNGPLTNQAALSEPQSLSRGLKIPSLALWALKKI